LYKLFYASPNDYFKYLGDTIQIRLEEDLVLTYVEIKATRDLVIHNKGRINSIYIQKSGVKARSKDTKQFISFSPEYYIKSFSALKKIVRCTYESASKEYLKITDPARLYVSKF
jgi:hypothetical protein